MKTQFVLLTLVVSAFLLLGNSSKSQTPRAPIAKAEIFSLNGSSVKGTIFFRQKSNKVIMHAELTGFLKEGLHAVSLHIDGVSNVGVMGRDDILPTDGSGTHWNPTGKPHGAHGAMSPNGDPQYHRGDIGNLPVEVGLVKMKFTCQEWTLDKDPNTGILGKIIAIHENPDDFTTQPDGGAGKIIAFGEIRLEGDVQEAQTRSGADAPSLDGGR